LRGARVKRRRRRQYYKVQASDSYVFITRSHARPSSYYYYYRPGHPVRLVRPPRRSSATVQFPIYILSLCLIYYTCAQHARRFRISSLVVRDKSLYVYCIYALRYDGGDHLEETKTVYRSEIVGCTRIITTGADRDGRPVAVR